MVRYELEVDGESVDDGELARSLPRLETLGSREAVVEYPGRGPRALAGLVGRKPTA